MGLRSIFLTWINQEKGNLPKGKEAMMKRKSMVITIVTLACLLALDGAMSLARMNPIIPGIRSGADRVVELQRTDSGWEGTWYWYIGSTGNATNLTGVTALGLVEAFRDVKDPAYFNATKGAADFILKHLGLTATETKYYIRTTAPDIVFLHQLATVSRDRYYAYRATVEWYNLSSFWPTAGDLDSHFHNINRPSAWDMAFFLEAAYQSGDKPWADGAAEILADYQNQFYYDDSTEWYALNLAGAVRALVGCGYYEEYKDAVLYFLEELTGLVDKENGVQGYIQETAYAVLAFRTVAGPAEKYADMLARWLASRQNESGGWTELDGHEYPEIDGEAVRALCATIGRNLPLDGFRPKSMANSFRKMPKAWRSARPFKED
jgi:hypothetical protein